jgi:signal peptidase I
MEITTAPRPPAPTPWGRWLLLAVLFGPVTLLVLLPIGLGLERYVIDGTTMDGPREGGISRGSIAFERVVPVSDLEVGDVITFPRPGAADGDSMVTHRIVAIGPEGIVTQGDALPATDPWTLRPDGPTLPRVEFAVPWVGWAYLVLFHALGWVVTVVSALVLVSLTVRRHRRRTPSLRLHPDGTTTDAVAAFSGARDGAPDERRQP